MTDIPTREKWIGMRHFPLGREIVGAVVVDDALIHPTATCDDGIIKTASDPWYYGLVIPVYLTNKQKSDLGANGLMVSVRLHVKSGTAGVAMMAEDEQVIEQIPAPASSAPDVIRFHVVPPEDLRQIIIRNWDQAGATQFSLIDITIHEAIRELPLSSLSSACWTDLKRLHARYLEFSITDYCNLNCPLCSQSTQLASRSKTYITLDRMRYYSTLIRPGEFDVLKISGGEPTLHPDFGTLCEELPTLFPIPRKELASNGARLSAFADNVGVFDEIDLTHYPGRNDHEFKEIRALSLPNVTPYQKCDYKELDNVNLETNLDRVKIFENCKFAQVKKVIGDRIYACPCIYGQVPIKNIPIERISVPFDEKWRENLSALKMEPICRRCFNLIEAPILIERAKCCLPA